MHHDLVIYLVHEFPAFLHSLLVHGAGLVVRVEVVMVWLESILHHPDQPTASLQISCHGQALLRSARVTVTTKAGTRDRRLPSPVGLTYDSATPRRRQRPSQIRARIRRAGGKGSILSQKGSHQLAHQPKNPTMKQYDDDTRLVS